MSNISEISSSFQETASSTGQGPPTLTKTRVFRVISNDSETALRSCGIQVGSGDGIGWVCKSATASFDGDSRNVILCTFQFEYTPNSQPPDVRPMDIAASTSLIEKPLYSWKPLQGPKAGSWVAPVNPAGDAYDALSRLEPLVTVTVTGFEREDPLRNCTHAGKVNASSMSIGSLSCAVRTLMFRGVSCQPAVETIAGQQVPGWRAAYEFAYRANVVALGGGNPVPIGWDIAVPQTGFNVINTDPAAGALLDYEVGSFLLKHRDGKIDGWPNPTIPAGTEGRKVRGMVLVHEYETGGASQAPCAQPIPLNSDGTPRSRTADPPVLVYRYQIYEEMDFGGFNMRF